MSIEWNEANVERLVLVYDRNANEETRAAQVKDLAAELGVTEAVVRGKLVSMGRYVAKATKQAKTEKGPDKAELVHALETALSVPRDKLESLTKANKAALQTLWDAFVRASEQANVDKEAQQV